MSENRRDAVGQEMPSQQDMAIALDRELVAQAAEKTGFWLAWRSTRYEELATEIAQGLRLEELALAACKHVLKMRRQNARFLEGTELAELPLPNGPYCQMTTDSFSEAVKLPGIKGAPHTLEEDAPFWGNPPAAEDFRLSDFRRREEIRLLRIQNAELRGEVHRLREKLARPRS
jgi:hypothetical protein